MTDNFSDMQVQFLRLRCPNLLLTIHGFFPNSPGSKQLVQGISTVRRKIPVSRQHHNKESEEEKLSRS